MKIVLINVKYSANLGDGVIAECLEDGLRRRLPDVEVVNCDLAGRTGYGANSRFLRPLTLRLLAKTPAPVRKSVYARILETVVRHKMLPNYSETINGADLAVFGGGQILADADLNFPMKIAAAASIVRQREMPIAIHAVGVGEHWSDAGADLFNEAFAGGDIVWTSVRDGMSRERWMRHFKHANLGQPRISLDPGLLAARTYATLDDATAPRRNRTLVGLCITHPTTLSTHFDGDPDSVEIPGTEFYRDCVRKLCEDSCDVLAFTNGAPDDETFMHRAFPSSFRKNFDEEQVRIADPSNAPEDLVATIRQCDVIASHRLHACIVAYACKIPHVGLALNRKLDAFFDLVDRRAFLLGPRNIDADAVLGAVRGAIENPIDESTHAAIISRVDADLDDLASRITDAIDARTRRSGR